MHAHENNGSFAQTAFLRARSLVLGLLALTSCVPAIAEKSPVRPLGLADPYIIHQDGIYYAYGTSSTNGIVVATSTDLKNWTLGRGRAPGGLALHKNDSYGTKNFWAPEVYHRNGKYIMYYSAEEHVCAAVADSPLGPFRQAEKKPILPTRAIDNSLFVDDDGRAWMTYAHLHNGNIVYITEMEKDLLHAKPTPPRLLFHANNAWEGPNINEGPFIQKFSKKYVITYSANHYRNPDYGVGFATADAVTGPWTKSGDNPILQRFRGLRGTGHHSFFKDAEGRWRIVFHAHHSAEKIHPRLTYIADLIVGGTPEAPRLSIGGELIACQVAAP